jgi:murein DD-endopeptidase MepM/ murein hydrolase activator NlpD
MRTDVRATWKVAALSLCLTIPGPLAPARGAARRRAVHAAATSHPKPASRKAIKAKIQASTQKIKQAKQQLHEKKEDIRNAQDQLRVKKAQVARLSDQIRELEVREMDAHKRLSGATKRLAFAERKVEEARHRLKKAQERLAAHQRRLSVRIRRGYTAGTVTFADVLLQATSLADFLDRQYYVDCIFHSDMEFLTDLREEKRSVELIQTELERKRDEQQAAKTEMSMQLQEVQGLKQSREDLLNRVETEKALKEEELRELEQDSSSIASMLESEWRRRQQLWRQLHHGMVPMPGWVGNWLRPVAGCPISSGFGMRFHPILGYARMHTGIDFAASLGTPIRAAADGDVVWASWRGGYGRCIIVLHGGGVATLYAHCSDIVVHAGQSVKRGQWIGNSGTTGLSTGPHLHFEIRVNGHPVNPLGR